MAEFEVIIPYFQRKPGLLARALESVFAQGVDSVRVHVVDDGSPRSARLDIAALPLDQVSAINLIEQANAGATAARNRGLAELSPDAQFVAFLDSDDVWQANHLKRAREALKAPDISLFFDRMAAEKNFAEGYERPSKQIDPDLIDRKTKSSPTFEISDPVKLLCGDWYRVLHLSVTVISASLARRVHFDEAFRLAEDFEFYGRCASQSGRWIADDRIGARRGTGENLWHGTQTTDTRYAREKYFTMRALKRLKARHGANPDVVEQIDERLALYRDQFYWSQRDKMRAGSMLDLRLVMQFVAYDPALLKFFAQKVTSRGQAVRPS